jgi:hypothetical protein
MDDDDFLDPYLLHLQHELSKLQYDWFFQAEEYFPWMDATVDMVMNNDRRDDRRVHWALKDYFLNDYCFAMISKGLVI